MPSSSLPPADPTSIRRTSGLPLHRQVELTIREITALPIHQAGTLLPSEIDLAQRLGVSRGTVRSAFDRLVQEGLLIRQAGVGTRVAPAAGESGIRAWRSFSEEMAAKGINVENFSTLCSLRPAQAAAARALRVTPGRKILRLDRVRGWHDRPVLLSRSWLHPRLGLQPDADFQAPLYELIARISGVIATTAHEEFQAVTATASIAKLLSVRPSSPLLLRRHAVADAKGHGIEYAEIYYVSNRFTLTLDLKKDRP